MPNAKYKLDPSGSYVKSDPFLESITKPKTPLSKGGGDPNKFLTGYPFNVDQPTTKATPDHQAPTSPAAAAVAPLTTPTAPTAPTAPSLVSQAPGNAGQPANATIWDPNTGEKKPWTIGAPMPGKDWKLWTGGTATGEEAQAAIIAGQPEEEAPPSPTDLAIKPLEDEEEVEDEKEEEEDKWEVPEVSEILEGMGIETTTVHDYTEDKQDLIDWRDNQLDEIDGIYEERFAEQTKADENSLSALQAQLLKAGVSLDGTSFQSATAGEIARASERMRKLKRDKASDIARINDSYLKGKMDLGKQERDEVWNAKVFDYDNIFKGKGIQKDMWTMFNERDQFERQMEQEEEQFLMTFNQEKHKLDQAELDKRLARIFKGAEQGLYDMYNEDTVNMLYGIEQFAKLEVGEIVDMGTGGYWNRMSNMTLKSAQTESMLASTEEKKLLLPYKIQKYESEIAKNRASAAKSLQSLQESNLFGDDIGQNANSLLNAASMFFNEEAVGEDGYIDTQKYKIAKNEFVELIDPKMKNESYFERLFLEYFPANKFLNPQDTTAKGLLKEYEEKLTLEEEIAKAIAGVGQ